MNAPAQIEAMAAGIRRFMRDRQCPPASRSADAQAVVQCVNSWLSSRSQVDTMATPTASEIFQATVDSLRPLGTPGQSAPALAGGGASPPETQLDTARCERLSPLPPTRRGSPRISWLLDEM
jgi:hypothetical protein